jgi:hypothetical protein
MLKKSLIIIGGLMPKFFILVLVSFSCVFMCFGQIDKEIKESPYKCAYLEKRLDIDSSEKYTTTNPETIERLLKWCKDNNAYIDKNKVGAVRSAAVLIFSKKSLPTQNISDALKNSEDFKVIMLYSIIDRSGTKHLTHAQLSELYNIFGKESEKTTTISSYSQLRACCSDEFKKINSPNSNVLIKNRYGTGLTFLEKIISEQTEQNRKKILSEIYSEKDKKAMYYIQAYILYYSAIGDKTMVLDILSHKCPSRIGICNNIESFLIRNTHFKYPFLIVIEAYRKSKEVDNKQNIAKIIRRSLKAMGITGENDSTLVDNAEKWYNENKDRLSFNLKYRDSPFSPMPLFIYKK